MEHEVYVPLSVGSVRAALAERERVARCVPGLQLDAASGGKDLQGRLRVRAGGTTITYRGRLRFAPLGDGVSVKGSGEEVRGSGTVKLSLKAAPRLADDGEGTRLTFAAKVTGDGRFADLEEKAATAAGRRLLDRFCEALVDSVRTDAPAAAEPDASPGPEAGGEEEPEARIDARQAAGLGEPDDNERAIPGIPSPEKGDRDGKKDGKGGKPARSGEQAADDDRAGAEAEAADAEAADAADTVDAGDGTDAADPGDARDDARTDAGTDAGADEAETSGVFEAEIPPPSLDPLSESAPDEDDVDDERAHAEAAHARRTMIGRSAEEVDHAPPRGRYAPVPAPEPGAATETLRWAAPAAALAVAGAVVLTRALRRRR